LYKEELLKYLLDFCEKKRVEWFTADEFIAWLIHKKVQIRISSIVRQLNKLQSQGYLWVRYITYTEWEPFPVKLKLFRLNKARAKREVSRGCGYKVLY
jgi:hypothetical protein